MKNIIKHWMDNSIVLVISENRKFIWPRIAKVANTSIYKGNIRKYDKMAFSSKSKSNKEEIKKIIDTQSLKGYFTFTFVRNPWDRLVSCYTYMQGQARGNNMIGNMDFKDFIYAVINNPYGHYKLYEHSRPQIDYFCKDGKIIIDYIGRFENLQKDWGYVANIINVPPELPVMNKSVKRLKYPKYYTKETMEMVGKHYEQEIDLLEYKF